MKKVPALIYIGAAILGYTAAELMTADKGFGIYIADYALILKVLFSIGVVAVGLWIGRRSRVSS